MDPNNVSIIVPRKSFDALHAIARRHNATLIDALGLCITTQNRIDALRGGPDFDTDEYPLGADVNRYPGPGKFDRAPYTAPNPFGTENYWTGSDQSNDEADPGSRPL
jgi:hypothetical protein